MAKIQNFRWGPCPYCGASGWETAATRGRAIREHDRPQGGRCLQSRKRNAPIDWTDDKSCGFAISTYPQELIEENVADRVREEGNEGMEEFVTQNGTVTERGWQQLNDDIRRLEINSLWWLKKKFKGARDEGHDTHADLIGTVWYDPSNTEQMELLELACQSPGRGERIDMQDASFGDLADTVWKGVSTFGASALGGAITFFDCDEEF